MNDDPRDEVAALRLTQALNVLDAVIATGEDLLARSVQRAPIEEGTLRGSAALTLIVNGRRIEGAGATQTARALVKALARDGGDLSIDAEVSFNTVYAARQHEELDWHHPLDGEAKYLERTLTENSVRYGRVIAGAADLRGRLAR